MFVLGCFERRVTLYSQQVRALNLIHSLFLAGTEREGRLQVGSRLLVIGGGAAGLTAAAGAAVRGCKVTVLEQLAVPLPMFRDNTSRWLHPHIYDWPEPGSESPKADLPVLGWTADKAEEVAKTLREEWESLQARYSIGFFPHAQDIRIHSQAADSRRSVAWNAAGAYDEEYFDAIILAVGFGLEKPLENAQRKTSAEGTSRKQTSSRTTRISLTSRSWMNSFAVTCGTTPTWSSMPRAPLP